MSCFMQKIKHFFDAAAKLRPFLLYFEHLGVARKALRAVAWKYWSARMRC